MTDVTLDLLDAEGELIVDGGFAGNRLYLGLPAALRGRTVMVNQAREGTATGASLLATWQDASAEVPLALKPVTPAAIPNLHRYREEWRRLAGG